MRTMDLITLESAEHTLVRQPQCASCGDPTLVSERSPKVSLTASPARHTTDGGYRIQPPQLTYDRLKRHISPYLGAITKLGAHEETGNGVTYSFTAGHNFAMVNDNMDLLRRNMRGQSGGKGRSEIQAKVSAMCEAIERYSAVWRGGEPVTRAAYDDLDPDVAVHMDELLGFSEAQVAGRERWNADPTHRLHLVPDPFRTDLPIDWSTGWSLTRETERMIPSGYAWYGHPDLSEHFYCVGDSNGGASGNTLEEAILQGFCEVVERDSVALWWYNRLRVPAFDLDSLEDPYVDTMRAFYASMDRDVGPGHHLRPGHPHLRRGLRAPPRRRGRDGRLRFAPGRADRRHPRPHRGQPVPAVRGPARRRRQHRLPVGRSGDPRVVQEGQAGGRALADPDPDQKPTTVGDFAPLAGHDLADHIKDCVSRAEAAGIEVIVLDQTRPDLDLCVVKVIAPGMRHFWRRLGPGRLYEVPTRTGRLEQPRTEDEMNPWNVFF